MGMIKLQDMTPDVYYNQSRDFQFIGRLFDVVLNSVKTRADTIYNCPLSQNSDSRLIDLMTMTLGFKSRHSYNVQQLTALCSAFIYIMKNKGNITSVQAAANTLLNADGVVDTIEAGVDELNHKLTLSIPETVTDINLLKDLLDYILPAGMECEIIREARLKKPASDQLATVDRLTWKWDSAAGHTDANGVGIDNTYLSKLPQYNQPGLADARVKATPGILANSMVWKAEDTVLQNIIPDNTDEGDND